MAYASKKYIRDNTQTGDQLFQSGWERSRYVRRRFSIKGLLAAVAIVFISIAAVTITVFFTVFYKADSTRTPEKNSTSLATESIKAAIEPSSTRILTSESSTTVKERSISTYMTTEPRTATGDKSTSVLTTKTRADTTTERGTTVLTAESSALTREESSTKPLTAMNGKDIATLGTKRGTDGTETATTESLTIDSSITVRNELTSTYLTPDTRKAIADKTTTSALSTRTSPKAIQESVTTILTAKNSAATRVESPTKPLTTISGAKTTIRPNQSDTATMEASTATLESRTTAVKRSTEEEQTIVTTAESSDMISDESSTRPLTTESETTRSAAENGISPIKYHTTFKTQSTTTEMEKLSTTKVITMNRTSTLVEPSTTEINASTTVKPTTTAVTTHRTVATTDESTTDAMKINSEWTTWNSWTKCSVTCGSGVHLRYRTCKKTSPLAADCIGDFVEQSVCSNSACPVNGKWTLWSSWDTCDVSCGGGIQTRTRTCIKSSNSDTDCVGAPTQQQICSDRQCPDCSITCLVGTLNEACDVCICESTIVEGRIVSTAGIPIDGALLAEDRAPTRIVAESNSTGFFILTQTCITSLIRVSRFGFQDNIVEISTTFQIIEMEFEVLPRMTQQPKSKYRLTGEDVVFCCSAVGSPNITYYEWFRDSVLLNKSLYQNNGTSLNLLGLNPADSGTYTCRANSPVRGIISAPAQLTVEDDVDDFCKEALQQKRVSLPSNCIQATTNTSSYEVGHCQSKGCRIAGENKTQMCEDSSISCCVPSRLEPTTVNCTDYELQVLVVKECSCGLCDATSIRLFGKAVDATSGASVEYCEVWVNGKHVLFTDKLGSFSLTLRNSIDMAILTLKDTYNSAYLDAVKIIDVTDDLSGSISFTIPMIRTSPPVYINSEVETVLKTVLNQNNSVENVAQISIPASSFYNTNGTKYSGNVTSKLTFLDPTDNNIEGNLPGRFQFTGNDGSTTYLASRGVFNLQFQDKNGAPLIVDDVIDVSFSERNDHNFTLWKLNKDTGVWEPFIPGSKTKRRKRRRTEGLIGEIDMAQIDSNTWLNLDEPFSFYFDELCFFKIRVYIDDKLSVELVKNLGFTMEFHEKTDNTLISYDHNTQFPPHTCFPASCQNNIGYIRFFFRANNPYGDSKDLYAAKPIARNVSLVYYIQDGHKTFKVKMTSDEKGPFYNEKAVCEASNIADNHLRFRIPDIENGFIMLEATSINMNASMLQTMGPQVWYPFVERMYKSCHIKIRIEIVKRTNGTERSLKFHAISQGDLIAGKVNFTFGVKELNVDVPSNFSSSSSYCVEYKCSGKLEGSGEMDFTRLKIGLVSPTEYRCRIYGVQEKLMTHSFFDKGKLNENKSFESTFDAYVPDDLDWHGFGLYSFPVLSHKNPDDCNEARSRSKKKCLKNRAEDTAFAMYCY